jgi:Rab5 GDP/GTP exchange factor
VLNLLLVTCDRPSHPLTLAHDTLDLHGVVRFLSNFSKRTFTVTDQVKLINDFLNVRMLLRCYFAAGAHPIGVVHLTEDAGSRYLENCLGHGIRQCDRRHGKTCDESIVRFVWTFFAHFQLLLSVNVSSSTFTPQIARSNPPRPITTDDLERDRVLTQRIALFGWIQPAHLDVPVTEGSNGFLLFAQQGLFLHSTHFTTLLTKPIVELVKINHYKAPRDKLICILNCCKVIFGPFLSISNCDRHITMEIGYRPNTTLEF